MSAPLFRARRRIQELRDAHANYGSAATFGLDIALRVIDEESERAAERESPEEVAAAEARAEEYGRELREEDAATERLADWKERMGVDL